MRSLFLFILLTGIFSVNAQTDTSFISTEVENEVYTMDFSGSKNMIYQFIKKYGIKLQSQNESKTDLKIGMDLTPSQYVIYDSILNFMGYSKLKKIKTINNSNKIAELKLELNFLRQKRESYIELLKKVDEKAENYLSLWNEQKQLEEKIFLKESDLLRINQRGNIFDVSLFLYDEVITRENTRVTFVNMPGVEYSYLQISTPKEGFSSDIYQGYFLKYLFTKGKSFGTVGAYKSVNVPGTDTATFSEMFVIGFGQDFYSRHLGRGSRRFLNLYSGYTIGGLFMTGKNTKDDAFYIAPSIGLEVFKNKYFLIDTKVNYFIPLNSTRNLRGVSYNASFNFVF